MEIDQNGITGFSFAFTFFFCFGAGVGVRVGVGFDSDVGVSYGFALKVVCYGVLLNQNQTNYPPIRLLSQSQTVAKPKPKTKPRQLLIAFDSQQAILQLYA